LDHETGIELDPDRMIVHGFDAGDVFGRRGLGIATLRACRQAGNAAQAI
jgi:hypothetical protein